MSFGSRIAGAWDKLKSRFRKDEPEIEVEIVEEDALKLEAEAEACAAGERMRGEAASLGAQHTDVPADQSRMTEEYSAWMQGELEKKAAEPEPEKTEEPEDAGQDEETDYSPDDLDT